MIRTFNAALIISIVLLITAILIQHHAAESARGSSVQGPRLLLGPQLSCAERPPAVLADLIELAPGHSTSELAATGDRFAQAIVPKQRDLGFERAALSSPERNGLLVVRPAVAGETLNLAPLHRSLAVRSVRSIYSKSAIPAYRSCDYQLADSAGATALLHTAERALISRGYVTQAQVAAPSTTFYVSDDPFTPGSEFVTVVLSKGVSNAALATGANPPVSSNLTPVVAAVDAPTMTVTATGFANWYAGQ
ncbi:MAG: hypothetical protein ACR2GA_07090 [Chloroflexota bacterium]